MNCDLRLCAAKWSYPLQLYQRRPGGPWEWGASAPESLAAWVAARRLARGYEVVVLPTGVEPESEFAVRAIDAGPPDDEGE